MWQLRLFRNTNWQLKRSFKTVPFKYLINDVKEDVFRKQVQAGPMSVERKENLWNCLLKSVWPIYMIKTQNMQVCAPFEMLDDGPCGEAVQRPRRWTNPLHSYRSNASHFSIWTRRIWCTVSSISEKSLASQVGSFLVLCNGRPIWDVRIKQKKNNIISKPLSCQSWRNRNQLFLHQTWENFETYFLNLSGLQFSDQALVDFSRWQ